MCAHTVCMWNGLMWGRRCSQMCAYKFVTHRMCSQPILYENVCAYCVHVERFDVGQKVLTNVCV